uniref:Uncharacterized protein n=1 Tax=Rousettus aegyptiacus TaxID=9407 RepID=A0A7J8JH31_ROUAE|nr:hypothetical protein HJG63_010395 [Rousettus aegyptiacus]
MEFDRRWSFARPRASWSSQTHRAWEGPARPWAASGLGGCARQTPLGIRWVPGGLAVNAASGGVKRARGGIQRALEKYPRGFRRSALRAENEIQLKKAPAAPPPRSPGPAGEHRCLPTSKSSPRAGPWQPPDPPDALQELGSKLPRSDGWRRALGTLPNLPNGLFGFSRGHSAPTGLL